MLRMPCRLGASGSDDPEGVQTSMHSIEASSGIQRQLGSAPFQPGGAIDTGHGQYFVAIRAATIKGLGTGA